MSKRSALFEAMNARRDKKVILMKGSVTRRGAVTGLVGAAVAPAVAASEANESSAATAAQVANAASLVVGTFENVELGLRATSPGETFWTRNPANLYLNDGNVAVLQDELATLGRSLGPFASTMIGDNPTIKVALESIAANLESTSGDAYLGSDDGQSGSLWTTIRGFITYLRSNAGSTIIGFTASVNGSVYRTVQAKLRDTVSVKDFGAVGDGVADDTSAIQSAINAASNSNFLKIHFPAGYYKYTTLRCYYDATHNPDFNVNRNGEVTLFGDGVEPENGGVGGTILYCMKNVGDAMIVSPVSEDSNPYRSREFTCRDITFRGNNDGYLVSSRGNVYANFENTSFIQENPNGGGLHITTAYFGNLSRCRFQNLSHGDKTRDAIRFGSTIQAGLFTLRDVNAAGYANGLHVNAGDWQLLSIYESQLTGKIHGIYVSDGRVQILNINGSYFEGPCLSHIKSARPNIIQSLNITGCWFLSRSIAGPSIDLLEPSTLSINGCTIQDNCSAFLNISGPPSGGLHSYVCQNLAFTYSEKIKIPVTYFIGATPALMGIEYDRSNSNITLYPSAAYPVSYTTSLIGSSYIEAGHVLETKTIDYGAVSGGSIDLQADGFPAMVWIGNISAPTEVFLPAISANLPHGYTMTVTSVSVSTQTFTVRTASEDGGVALASLAPGEQRKFVYLSKGNSDGWR